MGMALDEPRDGDEIIEENTITYLINKELFKLVSPFLEHLSILRVILGFIIVFFLPGFAWTLVFFRGKRINILERAALSFGLSIALVTLSILALHLLFGVMITGFNAVIIILIITVIPLVVYFFSKYLIIFPKKIAFSSIFLTSPICGKNSLSNSL